MVHTSVLQVMATNVQSCKQQPSYMYCVSRWVCEVDKLYRLKNICQTFEFQGSPLKAEDSVNKQKIALKCLWRLTKQCLILCELVLYKINNWMVKYSCIPVLRLWVMKVKSYNMFMEVTSKKASLDIRTLKESLKNGFITFIVCNVGNNHIPRWRSWKHFWGIVSTFIYLMKSPLTSLSLAYCKIKPSKLKDATLKCRNISIFNYLLYIELAHRQPEITFGMEQYKFPVLDNMLNSVMYSRV